ncbi:MAG: type 4a pilus biogenesis protein PilO [Candidatus Omnitrophica bacterium]|nr:type 4a pilus biogenesis protein PilO [Candidatus Omnitrophota bacterium]
MNILNIFAGMGKKEKLGLAVAVLIGSLAFFDRLVLMPISAGFRKINSEIKLSERQLAQSIVNVNNKEAIAKEYQKYLPYVKLDYTEGEETAKLLEAVESMGRSAGISITNVKPQPPKDSEIYRYYMIEIEAEGKMDALMNFLYLLGSSKELFRASRIQITAKDKEASIAKASILITKVVVM